MRRQEVVSIIIRVVCCLKGDDVVRYEVHVAVTLTCVEVKPAELEIACELFMFRVEHLLPLFSLPLAYIENLVPSTPTSLAEQAKEASTEELCSDD